MANNVFIRGIQFPGSEDIYYLEHGIYYDNDTEIVQSSEVETATTSTLRNTYQGQNNFNINNEFENLEAQIIYTAMKNNSLLINQQSSTIFSKEFLKEKIHIWYDNNLWTKQMVQEALNANILTQEDFNLYINQGGKG